MKSDSKRSTVFQHTACQKEHSGYKTDEMIFHHTVNPIAAKKMVRGYNKFIQKILKINLRKDNVCIDLGCGAGYITKEFQSHGLNIKGLEYSDDATNAIKRHNPDLDIVQSDMASFIEINTYDLIFSREVYLITRVNAFSDQYKVISNIIESLKSSGVFILVGSNISYPHCMDYDLIIKTFRKDDRLSLVTAKYYDIVFEKLNKYVYGKVSYKLLELLIRPVLFYKKRCKNKSWADKYIIAFIKR